MLASEQPTDAPQQATPPADRPSLQDIQAGQFAPRACSNLSLDSFSAQPSNHVLSASTPLPNATSFGFVSGPANPPPQTAPSVRTASSFSALGHLLQLLDEQPALGDNTKISDSTDKNKSTISTQQLAAFYSSSPALTARDESFGSFMHNLMSLRTPTVQRAIFVCQNSLFAAVMDNTLALGCLQGMQLMFSEDGNSPFYKSWAAATTSEERGSQSKGGSSQQPFLSQIRSQFAGTPKDLQPVDEQIIVEHHIYLDVLPFPTFRQKALQALAKDPPELDEDELCTDITKKDGLVIWGSLGNDQGMEACRPWDMRSWEPKPWFLRKYASFVGGWEDDMWKSTRWWHAVRNEKIPRSGGERQ